MDKRGLSFLPSHRALLKNVLPAGTMICLGCHSLFAQEKAQDPLKPAEKKHKFLEDSGMSFQEGFEFAYKESAQLMKDLGNEIRTDNLIEMIKRSSHEAVEREA